MILNDNFFLNPPNDIDDLKELLRWAAEEGIGSPLNKDGNPSGRWTPEGLADAISQLDTGTDGIDIRTVQLWFENNDRGISNDNINRLAKVFGCEDAESTKTWRVALLEAKSRQGAKRKDKAKRMKNTKTSRSHRFALWLDDVFDGRNPLSLPIVIWAGLTGVGFLAFAFGLHSVSYAPVQNQDKQVGFLWAPNWTILNLFLCLCF